jgi:D-arabinono-1,4-lactone oxidase
MTDADGFAHPSTEEELIELVRGAYREGRQLRVRGAAHSISHAIYSDPLAGWRNHVEQQTPPPGPNVNVMLDRYRGWRVVDEQRKLVEVDAGIHLGADPSDPTKTSEVETSLLYQLWHEKGWTLSDTGGITHQTVSGFTATGSSGGSVHFSANANLHAFRVIDGTGQVYEVSRDDDDTDLFFSMSPNLGLLGVVSKITLACVDAFNITGQEAITGIDDCSVDLFGPGSVGRPSLERFLREVEYARLEWWPQRGVDTVLTWQAQQIKPQPGFRPVRYEEFTNDPAGAEILISILYTVLGNLDDLDRAKELLKPTLSQLDEVIELLVKAKHLGWLGEVLARFVEALARVGVDAAVTMLKPLAPRIKAGLPELFPKLLGLVITRDSEKKGMQKGEPQAFHDTAWQGLPMDNQASDVLVPTEFTELWLPLTRTQEAMVLLRDYFSSPSDPHEAYARTGLYAWELYMAEPTSFWMNASHTDGADEWRDGVFRIDPYWFANNPGDPAEVFYPRLWALFRDAGIPFRLHWGKFQPVYAAGDRTWVDFFRAQYPRWDDFLALRARRDPNNIFLTSYWRDRFGLWDAPEPQPMS